MTAGRPRPVVRHLCRPLWWVAVSFSVTAVLLVLTVRDAEHLREGRNRWPRVVASVPVSYSNGRHEVPISYRHPVTGQIVGTKVVVVRRSLLPEPGGTLRIAVDPGNPDAIVIPGDGDEVPSAVFGVLIINGVVIAAGLARWLAVRRIERLIGSGQPSFAMIGSLERSRTDTRRVVLSLFPLDAAPGTAAVCACTVLTTAQLPIGPGFPVEVRGRPVPGGALVAHAGAGVLWPLRRPIGRGAAGRPTEVATFERPLVPADDAGVVGRRPSLIEVLGGLRLAIGAAAAVVLVVVPVVVTANGNAARRVASRGTVVLAEVVDTTGSGGVRVRYGSPGQPRDRKALAAGDRKLHRIYPAHVIPSDPNDLRLDADPYSNAQPYGWAGATVAGAALLIVSRIAWWREANRLVPQGPWYAIEHARDEGAGEVGLVIAGEPTPLAFYHGRLRRPAPARPLLVATTFDPGEPAVVADLADVDIKGPVRRRVRNGH